MFLTHFKNKNFNVNVLWTLCVVLEWNSFPCLKAIVKREAARYLRHRWVAQNNCFKSKFRFYSWSNNPFDVSECELLCKNKHICVNLQFFLVMVSYFCDQVASCFSTARLGYFMHLRWFETVFYFPFQLNFMNGLLVCCKRLLLLADSRCYNNLWTYQLLYSHWHLGCHGNLTDPQIHPISSIKLHFTKR